LAAISGGTVRKIQLVAALGAVLISACHDSPTGPSAARYTRLQRDWLSGDALVAYDSVTGLFRLPNPHPLSVSELSADSLAVAVAHFIANPNLIGNIREVLNADRGGTIDFANLQSCTRATYAASPYAELPPPIPGPIRRFLGASWAIPLCGSDGTAQLSVGVPDHPMDLRVANGQIVEWRQFGGGNNFDVDGVPFRYPFGLPMTPEEAVAAAVSASGRRVVSVPTMFNIGVRNAPFCASWRVVLDSAVTVIDRTTDESLSATELYVRHDPFCFSPLVVFDVPSATQLTSTWVLFPKDTTGLTGNFTDVDSAQVGFTGPTVFQRVVVIRHL
jgi:hypothetical protein